LFKLQWTHPGKREHALLLIDESVNKVQLQRSGIVSQTTVYCGKHSLCSCISQ